MRINEAFENISTFKEYKPFVMSAQEGITFFGYRYIYFPGYNGRLFIDNLIHKLDAILQKNFEFDEEERNIGKELLVPIRKIYNRSNERCKRANRITQIFSDFIELFCLIKNYECLKLKWLDFDPPLLYYTKSQYEKAFGKSVPNRHPWVCPGFPDRWEG